MAFLVSIILPHSVSPISSSGERWCGLPAVVANGLPVARFEKKLAI